MTKKMKARAKAKPAGKAPARGRARSKRAGGGRWGWALAAGGLAVLGGLGVLVARVGDTPSVAAAPVTADAGVPAAAPDKVKIVFQTVPPVKAEVRWGKKLLGVIKGRNKPFILERPRDSGPLDLNIRAEGFITVNTRAYTFNDSKMWIRLTPVAERAKLFGYRVEIPDGGVPDGGLPPVATSGTGLAPAAARDGGVAAVPGPATAPAPPAPAGPPLR